MTQYSNRSEVKILGSLAAEGYKHNMFVSDGRLYIDHESDKGYEPEECSIDSEHRFEGMSNPGDMSIVYAMSTKDGYKGTVVVAYGPQADVGAAEFFQEIEGGT